LNTGHAYGTITDTMDIITTWRKGKYLNTLEKCHIYKISREKLHMNDTHVDSHNPIFEALQDLHKITVHPLPTSPTPPPHYSINTKGSTQHIHNVHLQVNNIIHGRRELHADRSSKYRKKQYNITL
jgi:hypothetical protein